MGGNPSGIFYNFQFCYFILFRKKRKKKITKKKGEKKRMSGISFVEIETIPVDTNLIYYLTTNLVHLLKLSFTIAHNKMTLQQNPDCKSCHPGSVPTKLLAEHLCVKCLLFKADFVSVHLQRNGGLFKERAILDGELLKFSFGFKVLFTLFVYFIDYFIDYFKFKFVSINYY
jgi:hypothetical protein